MLNNKEEEYIELEDIEKERIPIKTKKTGEFFQDVSGYLKGRYQKYKAEAPQRETKKQEREVMKQQKMEKQYSGRMQRLEMLKKETVLRGEISQMKSREQQLRQRRIAAIPQPPSVGSIFGGMGSGGFGAEQRGQRGQRRMPTAPMFVDPLARPVTTRRAPIRRMRSRKTKRRK